VGDILRVISGSAKGHGLKTIKGDATRPTSDKVKGAVYNIIAAHIDGSAVLDMFAGTGSMGIEALSRGASSAVFFDKSMQCCRIIKENLEHTKLTEKALVFNMDYASGINKMQLEGRKFDIIIMDPPYNKNFIQEALKLLTKNDIIVDDGIIIAEHSVLDKLPESCGKLKIIDTRKYGDTMITIYKDGNNDQ
jgi:16S rRNA (guanine(966)-N(2))-methyltransferase RsmD